MNEDIIHGHPKNKMSVDFIDYDNKMACRFSIGYDSRGLAVVSLEDLGIAGFDNMRQPFEVHTPPQHVAKMCALFLGEYFS